MPPLRLFLLLSALLVGCSGVSAPRCYPVRGQVFYENQPVAEAMVVFQPLAGQSKDAPRPLAYTDAQGRFELTTLKTGDGAPAGEFAITIELREQRQVGEELVRDGPNVLPPRFADPQTSNLRYTVLAEKNDVPPLMLTAH